MRRTKKSGKRIAVLAALLLFLILAAVLLSLQIRTVSVSGSERYTDEQIESMIFDSKMGRNSVYCYYQYKFRPHKTIPFVEDYKIVFRGPTKVEIIVYEKSVVGYVSYMNSLMYFDKDGIIVESTSEKLQGIPLITGLRFGHIVLHRPLPVENAAIFDEILNLSQVLAVYGISVDAIHYNSDHKARLTIRDLVVELGDHTDMNGKVSELNDILEEYSDLSGTLYLDTYDESNNDPMYRFQEKKK